MVAVLTPPPSFEGRREFVGASEVAAVCGDSRFAGEHKIWLLKSGRAQPDPDNKDTRWGRLMEPVARFLYEQRFGVEIPELDHTLRHAEHAIIGATPDGIVRDSAGKPVKTVQIKATRSFAVGWGEDGTHDFPAVHYYQLQWEMAAAGVTRCDLVVLIDGERDIRVYPDIPFDADLFGAMLARVQRWWDTYVVPDVEPPVDGSQESADRLQAMWPEHRGDDFREDNDPATAAAFANLVDAKAATAAAEAHELACKNALVAIIRDAPGIQGAYGRASYKGALRRSLDTEALFAAHGISEAEKAAHTTMKPTARSLRLTPAK